ncbi:MAG: VTC domain-containing protein [Bacteroidia bacterium]
MSFNKSILDQFTPISLKEMDAAALQDRMDRKFAFHISKLEEILTALTPFYKILEVNGVRLNRYESYYFDDDNYSFYRMHHNTHGNRLKVRFRRYADSDLNYFEVKIKTNKDRTIKKRIKSDNIEKSLLGDSKNFYELQTNRGSDGLEQKIRIDYTRITLVRNDLAERATFDLFLTYKSGDKTKSFSDLVIAEVKQSKIDNSSPVTKMLKSLHITEKSLSKYCIGIYELHDAVKKNNFKPQRHIINKILSNINYGH